MALTAKSPEQLKADRVAREARDKESAGEKFSAQRAQWSGWFQIIGALLLIVGLWYLVMSPTIDGSVVNIQKLYLGQTAAIVGAMLFVSGALLKYLR